MARRALTLYFLSSVVGAAWVGCAAFDDAALPEPDDAGKTKVDAEAAVADTGCALARPPLTLPDANASGGALSFVVAAHDIGLGAQVDGGALPVFGYDLDGICTCKNDRESCVATGLAADKKTQHCDGDRGRDQAASQALAQLYLRTNVDPSSYLNDSIQKGTRGMLIKVDNYNGEPNDLEVKVSFYRSNGPERTSSVPRVPSFQLDEAWAIDLDDLVNPTTLESKHVATGFVRDSTLVALLQTSVLPFNDDSDINLHEVVFTAKIETAPGGFALTDAVAAGRWAVDDVLTNVARIQQPQDSSKRLCQDDVLMAGIIRPLVCLAADINETAKLDNQGSPCNALSTAVAFRATPAKLGKVEASTFPDPCAGKTIQSCAQ